MYANDNDSSKQKSCLSSDKIRSLIIVSVADVTDREMRAYEAEDQAFEEHVDAQIVTRESELEPHLSGLGSGAFTELWLFGDDRTAYAERAIGKARSRSMVIRHFGKRTSELGLYLNWGPPGGTGSQPT